MKAAWKLTTSNRALTFSSRDVKVLDIWVAPSVKASKLFLATASSFSRNSFYPISGYC
jgi:hypothetical protein